MLHRFMEDHLICFSTEGVFLGLQICHIYVFIRASHCSAELSTDFLRKISYELPHANANHFPIPFRDSTLRFDIN